MRSIQRHNEALKRLMLQSIGADGRLDVIWASQARGLGGELDTERLPVAPSSMTEPGEDPSVQPFVWGASAFGVDPF